MKSARRLRYSNSKKVYAYHYIVEIYIAIILKNYKWFYRKTICKTCFSVLETAQHFNTANTAYHKEDTRHEDIDDTESYIIYLVLSC